MRHANVVAAGVLAAFGLAAGVCGFADKSAADPLADFYRGKDVGVYIGYAPGGGYDLTARTLARHMGRHLPGNPTLVPRNMPGAGSLMVANWLYDVAPKDGTAFGTFGRTIPLDPLLGNKAATFDALKFTWLGSPSDEVSTCVAWHDSPVKKPDDLRRHTLVVGAAGPTSPSATFPKIFNAVLGTKIQVISGYPSSANSLLAMEQGETAGFCAWGWVPMKAFCGDWLTDKKITVLFQIALAKHKDYPDVPLVLEMAETDEQRDVLKLVIAPQKFARPFAAPPNLPPDRASALRQAFNATVRDAQFLVDADKQQLEIDLVTAEETERLLAELYNTPPAIVARAKDAME